MTRATKWKIAIASILLSIVGLGVYCYIIFFKDFTLLTHATFLNQKYLVDFILTHKNFPEVGFHKSEKIEKIVNPERVTKGKFSKTGFYSKPEQIRYAFMIACYCDHLKIAKLLIEKYGAKVSDTFEDSVMLGTHLTPLIQTARGNAVRVAKLLIEHGADVNFKNYCKKTAIFYTSMANAADVAKLLIENGADVNHCPSVPPGETMMTPIFVAAINDSLEVAKLLIEAGADVNLPEGYTPIMVAADYHAHKVLDLLIANGADITKALHFALAGYSNPDNNVKIRRKIVISLLKAGADPYIKGFGGVVPLFS